MKILLSAIKAEIEGNRFYSFVETGVINIWRPFPITTNLDRPPPEVRV
jgi:hypothetical protein